MSTRSRRHGTLPHTHSSTFPLFRDLKSEFNRARAPPPRDNAEISTEVQLHYTWRRLFLIFLSNAAGARSRYALRAKMRFFWSSIVSVNYTTLTVKLGPVTKTASHALSIFIGHRDERKCKCERDFECVFYFYYYFFCKWSVITPRVLVHILLHRIVSRQNTGKSF